MNTIIDIPALLSACEFVGRLIPPRVIVPLLGCIRIEASDISGLIVSHSGHDGFARAVVHQCDVLGDGSAAVDAATLISALRSLDGETATMRLDGSKLRISTDRRKVALGTFPVSEIPDARTCKGKATVIDGKFLAHAIDVSLPVAKNTAADRFAMRGMFLHGDGETLNCVATDGKRLHIVAGPWVGEIKAILPVDAMQMVRDMASLNDTLALSSDDHSISVVTEDWSITVAMAAGNFPPYLDVLPKDLVHVLNVDAKAMADAAKSVGFMVDEDASAKRGVEFTLGGGTLTLSASDAIRGDATAALDVDGVMEEYGAAYNSRFLREAFAVCEGLVAVLVGEKRLGRGPLVARSGYTTVALMPIAKE